MSQAALRTVIVEDAPVLRRQLRRMLEAHSGVSVVAECGDGAEATQLLSEIKADVVFTDIELPKVDGIELARWIADGDRSCQVVFITAYESYAISAFGIGAVDYVLKPLEAERLERSLIKVRSAAAKWMSVNAGRATPQHLLLKTDNRQLVVHCRDLRWIEAEGNYVRYHVGEERYLCRSSIASVESMLGGWPFCRISRGTIVNIKWIRVIESLNPHGDGLVGLRDGTSLPVSRMYRRELEQCFLRV